MQDYKQPKSKSDYSENENEDDELNEPGHIYFNDLLPISFLMISLSW